MDEVDDSMPVLLFLFPSFFFASWVPRPSMDDFTIRWMTESFLISFSSRNRALVVNNGRKGYKRGDVSVLRCMDDWIARAGLY